jgi:hypothetical protein
MAAREPVLTGFVVSAGHFNASQKAQIALALIRGVAE